VTAAAVPVRPFDVVVVAAGESRRMGGVDKLDAPIGGRPLLAWTIRALAAAPGIGRIAIATAPGRVAALAQADWLPAIVTAVVAGGGRRQESVAAGFEALDPPDDRIVLVHDGARPIVRPELVTAIASAAQRYGAAIPTVPITETLKRVRANRVLETVDRDELGVAQTPQGVRAGDLRRAWAFAPPGGARTFTDEASLLEAVNISVHAISGDPSNIKVTVAADLTLARAALVGDGRDEGAQASLRVGFGTDSHPFGPGDPLALGGIIIDGAPRLAGHSDGDVALHAVADALLGAAGLGDLGRAFPAGPETPSGVASGALVASVVRRLAAAGYSTRSVDVTIVAARPRLAGRLDEMRDAIADLLGLAGSGVDVKASTGNLAGMEGAGRGISAHAVALVGPIETGRGSRAEW